MENIAKKTGLVVGVLTFIFIVILDLVFKIDNTILRIVIAASLAALLAPRRKKIKTQTGEKTQITWIFLKKPILID